MSTTTTFTVTGMTYGVTTVDAELATGTVTVASDRPVDPAAVAAAVDEAGYEVTAS